MKTAALASLVLVLACSRGERESAAVVDAGPIPAASTPAASSKPSTEKPTTFSRALVEGRAHAREKRWSDAVAAFERALALEPDNVVVLNELGWAAFNAGDDTRAQRANERALALSPTPAQEAQALYNEGRRLEALGKLDLARSMYERSLAARDNEVVQKRLESLDRDAGSPIADASAPARSNKSLAPCATSARSEAELRTCLEGVEPTPTGQTFFFEPEPDVSGLPAKTRIVRFGTKSDARKRTRSTLLLVAEVGPDWLPLATLGSGFETSTSARREASFGNAEKKADHVWFFHSTQRRLDQSLGGLEVKEDSTELLTVCVLDDGAPTCPVQLPLATRDKLAYPSLQDLDATEQATVKDRIRDLGPPYDKRTKLSVSVDKPGTALIVTLSLGKQEDVPRGVLGTHALR